MLLISLDRIIKNLMPRYGFLLLLFLSSCKVNTTLVPVVSNENRSLSAGWEKRSNWIKQHEMIVAICDKAKATDILFIGNSITQSWGSPNRKVMGPGFPIAQKLFKDYNIINAGISGDRIEHILWRVLNGNFEKVHSKYVILSVGVNNFRNNNAVEIAAGIANLVSTLTEKCKDSKLILFGLLPTGKKPESPRRKKYNSIQKKLSRYLQRYPDIIYYNAIKDFTNSKNELDPNMYATDGIHLTAAGYKQWGAVILKLLKTAAQK